jgi:DNA-binding NarL/FixJ family response regulator
MNLTERQIEVFRGLLKGKSPQQIAGELGIKASTVNATKFNIKLRLGIHNNMDLLRWGIKNLK